MISTYLGERHRFLKIEMACARIRDLLARARLLEANDHPMMAEFARDEAAKLLRNLEDPQPTSPLPRALARRAA